MDHSTMDHTPIAAAPASSPASHESHMEDLLNGLEKDQGAQLLGMLHVPLLHGGFKEVLLLPSFFVSSPATLALACLVLAICTASLEFLRVAASWMEKHQGGEAKEDGCACKHCTSVMVSLRGAADDKQYNAIHDTQDTDGKQKSSTSRFGAACGWYLATGFLHLVIYLSSTLLMLVAMTMNVYLILAMGIGATLGKLITPVIKRRFSKHST